MNLDEARALLDRYRGKQSECVSSREWADALQVVLTALDGHPYESDLKVPAQEPHA